MKTERLQPATMMDIVPVSDIARMLAMMEAMAGTFYITILISRLVALYSSGQLSAGEPRPPSRT
jgi:hypothetical protein